MSGSVKQRIGVWLVLAVSFLAGTSAGSLGQLLYWRLWNERHQAMGSHATGDEIGLESKTRLKRKACRANRAIGQQLETSAIVFDCALVQPNMDNTVGQILGANDREYRSFVLEQIADTNLYVPVVITQRHKKSGTGRETTLRRLNPFTDARAGLTRTRSAISLSPTAHRDFEPGRQANGGLSTIEEIL